MKPSSHPIKLIISDSAKQVSENVAQRMIDLVKNKTDATLGLATGGTPIGVYKKLIAAHRDAGVSFANVRTFNLDEYVGLDSQHPQSYRRFMQTQLFDSIDIDHSSTVIPDGVAGDLAVAAKQHEDAIEAGGGIDLQLLGIGSNGHIAFNEPGSPPDCRTRVVDLTPSTIEANARFFQRPEDVPTRAITMGIGTILESRSIIVMATGTAKAVAVRAALQGPVDQSCPASWLRGHDDVTWYLDQDAAAMLSEGLRLGGEMPPKRP